MEFRQLGTTGVRVSEIAYGTFPLGTYTDTDAGVADDPRRYGSRRELHRYGQRLF